jgi:hypothetical protein
VGVQVGTPRAGEFRDVTAQPGEGVALGHRGMRNAECGVGA